jgi:DNA-binding MarR family transcriptional regulator
VEAATKARTKRRTSDRELATRLGSLLLFCMGGRADELIRVIDESGLSFVQMKALVTLETTTRDVSTVTGLSEALGVSAASASRAADELVKKGLASRVEDTDDRRIRRLKLTGKGDELANQIISARLAGLEDFAASLNPTERKRLDSALEALLERDELAEIYETYSRRHRR